MIYSGTLLNNFLVKKMVSGLGSTTDGRKKKIACENSIPMVGKNYSSKYVGTYLI